MPLLDAQLASRLEQLMLVARRLGYGRLPGRRLSLRKGRSPEFSDYRDYSEGDDPRFLDWNLFQRLGKPYLKLFLKEEDLQVQILLDTSASMRNKFHYSRQLTAAIGYIALCGGNRLELLALRGGRFLRSPVFHGRTDAGRLFTFLDELRAEGSALPVELAHELERRKIAGYGLRLLISDFLGDFPAQELFALFCAGRHEAHAIHLLAPEDVAPPFSGRLRLRDAETAQEIVCEARNVLPAYQNRMQSFCRELREICRYFRCGYALVSSEKPLEDVVTQSLLLSGLLR